MSARAVPSTLADARPLQPDPVNYMDAARRYRAVKAATRTLHLGSTPHPAARRIVAHDDIVVSMASTRDDGLSDGSHISFQHEQDLSIVRETAKAAPERRSPAGLRPDHRAVSRGSTAPRAAAHSSRSACR